MTLARCQGEEFELTVYDGVGNGHNLFPINNAVKSGTGTAINQ